MVPGTYGAMYTYKVSGYLQLSCDEEYQSHASVSS